MNEKEKKMTTKKAAIPARLVSKNESLEADGAITIYSLESGRVVAQYEGLEVHEAMQENGLLHDEITRLQKQYDDAHEDSMAYLRELAALRQRVAALDNQFLDTRCENHKDSDYPFYCTICGKPLPHLASESAPTYAALRERVAALEEKLLVARHWLLGIYVDLYPDQSGDLLAKFSTDEVERLEALLNELGQLDLGALATAEGGE